MATPRGKSPAFSRMEKHRNLYKNTSPQWRDTYRKRCFERLRSSRENLIQKFRGSDDSTAGGEAGLGLGSVVKDVMAEEWKLMQWEQRQAIAEMKLRHGQIEDGLLEDLNNDVVHSLMEDIQKELMTEVIHDSDIMNLIPMDRGHSNLSTESAIIAEYEASQQLADASLSAAVEQLDSDGICCPICKRNPLMLSKGVIFCSCGARINTEQDCLTLANVRQQLEGGVGQHSRICHSQPDFTITDAFSAQNLVLSCQICDFLYIVI